MASQPISDQDSVTADIHVAAPAERVFAAITDPKQVGLWWGDCSMYRANKWQTDLRKGGKWRTDGKGADGREFYVGGEYLEIDPPRLLVHTWVSSYMPEKTIVRWELTPEKGGTRVVVHHSGFAGNVEQAKSHGQGWFRVLGWMQGYVDRGETVDTRP